MPDAPIPPLGGVIDPVLSPIKLEDTFSDYESWANGRGVTNEEPIDSIKNYADYVKEWHLNTGELTDEIDTSINAALLQKAQQIGAIATPDVDPDFESNAVNLVSARDIASDRKVSLVRQGLGDIEADKFAQRLEADPADPYVNTRLNEAKALLVRKGEIPFATITSIDGSERNVIGGLASRGAHLGDAFKRSVMAGTVSYADAAQALRFSQAKNSDGLNVFEQQELSELMVEMGASKADKSNYDVMGGALNAVKQAIVKADKQALSSIYTPHGAIEDAREALQRHYSKTRKAYGANARSRFSDKDIGRALQIFATQELNHSGALKFFDDPEYDTRNIRVFGGVPMAHPTLMLKRDRFEEAVDIDTRLTDDQRVSLKQRRQAYVSGAFDHYKDILDETSATGSKWRALLQAGRVKGTPDVDILDNFLADPENYSHFKNQLNQFGSSLEASVAQIWSFPAQVFGSSSAREYNEKESREDARRREVASLFGEEFSWVLDAAGTASAVVVDALVSLGLAAFTGGVVGLGYLSTKAGARVTGKGLVKKAMGLTLLKPKFYQSPKQLAEDLIANNLIKTSGTDVAKIGVEKAIEAYTRAMSNRFMRQTTMAIPWGTRSGGGMFVSVYGSLPDTMTHEEKHAIALGAGLKAAASTILITSAFSKMGLGGFEDSLLNRGLSFKEMKHVLTKLSGQKVGNKKAEDLIKTRMAEAIHELNRPFNKGVGKFLKARAMDTLPEGLEEGLDEFVQSFIEAAALDEDRPLIEHINRALVGARAGALIGGAMTPAMRAVNRFATGAGAKDAESYEHDQIQDIISTLEENNSPLAAAELRNWTRTALARGPREALPPRPEGTLPVEEDAEGVEAEAEAEATPPVEEDAELIPASPAKQKHHRQVNKTFANYYTNEGAGILPSVLPRITDEAELQAARNDPDYNIDSDGVIYGVRIGGTWVGFPAQEKEEDFRTHLESLDTYGEAEMPFIDEVMAQGGPAPRPGFRRVKRKTTIESREKDGVDDDGKDKYKTVKREADDFEWVPVFEQEAPALPKSVTTESGEVQYEFPFSVALDRPVEQKIQQLLLPLNQQTSLPLKEGEAVAELDPSAIPEFAKAFESEEREQLERALEILSNTIKNEGRLQPKPVIDWLDNQFERNGTLSPQLLDHITQTIEVAVQESGTVDSEMAEFREAIFTSFNTSLSLMLEDRLRKIEATKNRSDRFTDWKKRQEEEEKGFEQLELDLSGKGQKDFDDGLTSARQKIKELWDVDPDTFPEYVKFEDEWPDVAAEISPELLEKWKNRITEYYTRYQNPDLTAGDPISKAEDKRYLDHKNILNDYKNREGAFSDGEVENLYDEILDAERFILHAYDLYIQNPEGQSIIALPKEQAGNQILIVEDTSKINFEEGVVGSLQFSFNIGPIKRLEAAPGTPPFDIGVRNIFISKDEEVDDYIATELELLITGAEEQVRRGNEEYRPYLDWLSDGKPQWTNRRTPGIHYLPSDIAPYLIADLKNLANLDSSADEAANVKGSEWAGATATKIQDLLDNPPDTPPAVIDDMTEVEIGVDLEDAGSSADYAQYLYFVLEGGGIRVERQDTGHPELISFLKDKDSSGSPITATDKLPRASVELLANLLKARSTNDLLSPRALPYVKNVFSSGKVDISVAEQLGKVADAIIARLPPVKPDTATTVIESKVSRVEDGGREDELSLDVATLGLNIFGGHALEGSDTPDSSANLRFDNALNAEVSLWRSEAVNRWARAVEFGDKEAMRIETAYLSMLDPDLQDQDRNISYIGNLSASDGVPIALLERIYSDIKESYEYWRGAKEYDWYLPDVVKRGKLPEDVDLLRDKLKLLSDHLSEVRSDPSQLSPNTQEELPIFVGKSEPDYFHNKAAWKKSGANDLYIVIDREYISDPLENAAISNLVNAFSRLKVEKVGEGTGRHVRWRATLDGETLTKDDGSEAIFKKLKDAKKFILNDDNTEPPDALLVLLNNVVYDPTSVLPDPKFIVASGYAEFIEAKDEAEILSRPDEAIDEPATDDERTIARQRGPAFLAMSRIAAADGVFDSNWSLERLADEYDITKKETTEMQGGVGVGHLSAEARLDNAREFFRNGYELGLEGDKISADDKPKPRAERDAFSEGYARGLEHRDAGGATEGETLETSEEVVPYAKMSGYVDLPKVGDRVAITDIDFNTGEPLSRDAKAPRLVGVIVKWAFRLTKEDYVTIRLGKGTIIKADVTDLYPVTDRDEEYTATRIAPKGEPEPPLATSLGSYEPSPNSVYSTHLSGDDGSDHIQPLLSGANSVEERRAVLSEWMGRNPLAAGQLSSFMTKWAKIMAYKPTYVTKKEDGTSVYTYHEDWEAMIAEEAERLRKENPDITDEEAYDNAAKSLIGDDHRERMRYAALTNSIILGGFEETRMPSGYKEDEIPVLDTPDMYFGISSSMMADYKEEAESNIRKEFNLSPNASLTEYEEYIQLEQQRLAESFWADKLSQDPTSVMAEADAPLLVKAISSIITIAESPGSHLHGRGLNTDISEVALHHALTLADEAVPFTDFIQHLESDEMFGQSEATQEAINGILNYLGYDSVIDLRGVNPMEPTGTGRDTPATLTVFDSRRIKSGNPITFDNDGQIILPEDRIDLRDYDEHRTQAAPFVSAVPSPMISGTHNGMEAIAASDSENTATDIKRRVNDAVGLVLDVASSNGVEVTVVRSRDYAPGGSKGSAPPMWAKGKMVYINPYGVARAISGLQDKDALHLSVTMVSEEMAHVASWNTLSRADVQEVIDSIGKGDFTDIADEYYQDQSAKEAAFERLNSPDPVISGKEKYRLIEEKMRMHAQRVVRGFTTEEDNRFFRSNPTLLQRAIRYLKGFLRRLLELRKVQRQNPHLARATDRIVTQLRAMRGNFKAPDIEPFDVNNPEAGMVALASQIDSTANLNDTSMLPVKYDEDDDIVKQSYDLLGSPLLTSKGFRNKGARDFTKPDYEELPYDITEPNRARIDAAIDSGAIDRAAALLAKQAEESLSDPELPEDIGQANFGVWGARSLRRLLYKAPVKASQSRWRIQPPAERGVSYEDFLASELIFNRAAKQLDMDTAELHAVMQFAEKKIWAGNGWVDDVGVKEPEDITLYTSIGDPPIPPAMKRFVEGEMGSFSTDKLLYTIMNNGAPFTRESAEALNHTLNVLPDMDDADRLRQQNPDLSEEEIEMLAEWPWESQPTPVKGLNATMDDRGNLYIGAFEDPMTGEVEGEGGMYGYLPKSRVDEVFDTFRSGAAVNQHHLKKAIMGTMSVGAQAQSIHKQTYEKQPKTDGVHAPGEGFRARHGRLIQYWYRGGRVFLDSGAFAAFSAKNNILAAGSVDAAVKAGYHKVAAAKVLNDPKSSLLNWDKVLEFYEEWAALAINPTDALNLTVVAPDIIGDPVGTKKLLTTHKDRLLALMDKGVTVVVPAQRPRVAKDEASFAYAISEITSIFGENTRRWNFVVGAPSAKAVWSKKELETYVDQVSRNDIPENQQAYRIHMLGANDERVRGLSKKSTHVLITGDTTADFVKEDQFDRTGRPVRKQLTEVQWNKYERVARDFAKMGEAIEKYSTARPLTRGAGQPLTGVSTAPTSTEEQLELWSSLGGMDLWDSQDPNTASFPDWNLDIGKLDEPNLRGIAMAHRGAAEFMAPAGERLFIQRYPNYMTWEAITYTSGEVDQPKKSMWVSGGINADIGGGAAIDATNVLRELHDVTNVVYDPTNRSAEHNEEAAKLIRGGQADTATVNSVLHSGVPTEVRAHAIELAADALKPDGTAYFLITQHGGDRYNESYNSFIKEIKQGFGEVSRDVGIAYRDGKRVGSYGRLITARKPKKEIEGEEPVELASSIGSRPPTDEEILKATEFRHVLDLFDLPVLKTGDYKKPSKYKWLRWLTGSLDPRVRSLDDQRKFMMNQSLRTVTKFHDNLKAQAEAAYGSLGKAPVKVIAAAIGNTRGARPSSEDAKRIENTLQDGINKINAGLKAEERVAKKGDITYKEIRASRKKAKEEIANLEKEANKEYAELTEVDRLRIIRDRADALDLLSNGNDTIPAAPELVDTLDRMRKYIDALSVKVKQLYGVSPELEARIDDQLGIYLTRSYRIFNESGWADKVLSDPSEEFQRLREKGEGFFRGQFINAQTSMLLDKSRRDKSKALKANDKVAAEDAEISASEAAESARRQYEALSEGSRTYGQQQVEAFIDAYRNKGYMPAGFAGKSEGYKPLTDNLKRKKDLDPVLQDLLGVYGEESFFDNTFRTFMSLSTMAANQNFLVRVAEMGREQGWLLTQEELNKKAAEDPDTYGGGNYVAVRDNVSSYDRKPNTLYDPFVNFVDRETGDTLGYGKANTSAASPLFAPKEFKEAMEKTFEPSMVSGMLDEASEVAQTLHKIASRATGLSMAVKTLGSIGFYIRNIASNMLFFAPAQGFFSYRHMTKHLLKEGKRTMRWSSPEKIDAYYGELDALGIIGDELRPSMLKELVMGETTPETMMKDLDTMLADAESNPALKQGKKFIEKLQELSRSVDAFYKIAYFEHELSVLRKAKKHSEDAGITDSVSDLSESELKREAARKVLMTAQSYSQAPPFVKGAIKSWYGIVFAPFLRFKVEVPRIMINTGRLIWEEINSDNKVIKNRGYRRLSGFTLAVGGLGTGMSYLISHMFGGLTDEEEEANRASMPHYLRSHTFITYKRDGELRSLDLTYINPFATMLDPMMRAFPEIMRNDVPEATREFMTALFANQFLDEQIMFGTVQSMIKNKNPDTDQPIVEATDSAGDALIKWGQFLFSEALVPPSMERIGKGSDVMQMLMGDNAAGNYDPIFALGREFYPAREYTIKPTDQLERYLRTRSEEMKRAKMLTRRLRWDNISDADIRDIALKDVEKRMRINKDLQRMFKGFESMGIPEGKIYDIAKAKNFGKRRLALLHRGYMERPTLSKEFQRELINKGEDFARRIEIFSAEVNKMPRFIPLDD